MIVLLCFWVRSFLLKIYPNYMLYLVLFVSSLIVLVSSADLSKSGGNLRLFKSSANKAELWVHLVRRLWAREQSQLNDEFVNSYRREMGTSKMQWQPRDHMCMKGRSYRKERGRTRERKKEWIKRKWDGSWGVEEVKCLKSEEERSGDECIRQVGLRIGWEDWDWQKMEAKPVLRRLRNGELARNMMLG